MLGTGAFDSRIGTCIAYGGALLVDAAITYGAYWWLRHNDLCLLYALPVTTAAAVAGVVPSVGASFTLADIIEGLFLDGKKSVPKSAAGHSSTRKY